MKVNNVNKTAKETNDKCSMFIEIRETLFTIKTTVICSHVQCKCTYENITMFIFIILIFNM